jgi:hypothetical protein
MSHTRQVLSPSSALGVDKIALGAAHIRRRFGRDWSAIPE